MSGRNTIYVLFFSFWISFSLAAYLPEGAPCNADGYPGTCRLWKKCFNLLLDIRDKEYPPLCSFEGREPIICCTSCDLTEDVSKIVLNPTGGLLRKTDQISWNKCIDYALDLPYEEYAHQEGTFGKSWNSTRACFQFTYGIVAAAGGRDANRVEYPHMALLGYGDTKHTSQWLCGGTLLNERFILTAGHCISSKALGKVRYAALGILKRSDPPELWQTYNIRRTISHPQYRSPSKYHDIALLQTTRRILFNKYVLPACLPNLKYMANENDATATGWGTTGVGTELADNLQTVSVSKFSRAKCSTLFKRHRLMTRGYSHATQMCYGGLKNLKDTCDGDSGGPLQISSQTQAYITQSVVIGVTSHGPACKTPGQAGVYTRVRPYVPWIDSVIW